MDYESDEAKQHISDLIAFVLASDRDPDDDDTGRSSMMGVRIKRVIDAITFFGGWPPPKLTGKTPIGAKHCYIPLRDRCAILLNEIATQQGKADVPRYTINARTDDG